MVGTNPHTSTVTTSVPVEIIPLRFKFANGAVFDGTPRVAAVQASAIFQPASFSTGTTQYGDAIQRAEFWHTVSGNGGEYHALLDQPIVRPTVTIDVPVSKGVTGSANGVAYGLVEDQWFFVDVIQRLVHQMHLDPAGLPIFLSDAVYTDYKLDPANCCVTGFHATISASTGPVNGQGSQQINTFIWASWDHPEHFGNGSDLGGVSTGGDIDVLTHEIAEWYNDPFIDNITPAWTSPLAPEYGCSKYLEVGDPVIVADFVVGGLHLQDAVFKSWFAHDMPSEGIDGRYTYLDTFAGPSTLC
jgi:hypothetical protein